MKELPKGGMSGAFIDDKLLVKMQAIIQSMTPKERRFPILINGSRKQRISAGSGSTLQDVNKLLKQFTQMQKIMKRMKDHTILKYFKEMQGQLPGDLLNKLPPDWFNKIRVSK